MARELLWDEDGESVYGWANDFNSKEEFEKAVKSDHADGPCIVYDIEKRLCISTAKGIEAETLCPVETTDIEMVWFYIAQVDYDERKIDEGDKECCAMDCHYKEQKHCNLYNEDLHGSTRCPACFLEI